MQFVWLVAGLGFLVLGAETLVRGGVGLGKALNLSPLLIGVTVVAYGTSTPELVVSMDAALKGIDGIAVGNVVGSNIANSLLVLGAASFIHPMALPRNAILRDSVLMLFVAALFITIALTSPRVEAWHGAILVAILIGVTVLTYAGERGQAEQPHAAADGAMSPLLAAAMIGGGIAMLVVGGQMLVDSAVLIARWIGVSETVIGLSVVAAGTSLPELATSVVAAFRRQSEIAFGNVVGSNIYNVVFILGATSLVTPVAIDPAIVRADMWMMLGATLACAVFARTGFTISRGEGFLLLAAYSAYMIWLFGAAGG